MDPTASASAGPQLPASSQVPQASNPFAPSPVGPASPASPNAQMSQHQLEMVVDMLARPRVHRSRLR